MAKHMKLYNNTVKKRQFCEESGFNYAEIWESEWLREKGN